MGFFKKVGKFFKKVGKGIGKGIKGIAGFALNALGGGSQEPVVVNLPPTTVPQTSPATTFENLGDRLARSISDFSSKIDLPTVRTESTVSPQVILLGIGAILVFGFLKK